MKAELRMNVVFVFFEAPFADHYKFILNGDSSCWLFKKSETPLFKKMNEELK